MIKNRSFSVGNRKIGLDEPTLIIGELSANHNQEYKLAVETIKAMVEAGVDAIKLQTYTPDTITIDSNKPDFQIKQGTLWGGQTLYNLYKSAYTPWEWQPKLKKVANKLGVPLFSSPFDKTAVDFLEEMDVPAYKVASFEITDIPLIKYMASKKKPIIMSTGVSTLEDIKLAVQACKDVGNEQIVLLKCTSEYPTPMEDVNLRTLVDMQKRFDTIVGISDHTMGIGVPVAAVTLGAKVVEKHIILKRSLGGPDSQFSLEPSELKELVSTIRNVEKALGRVTYDLSPKALRNRKFARSLYVISDVKKGEKVTEENVLSKRPSYGMHPKHYEEMLGKIFKQNVKKGTRFEGKLVGDIKYYDTGNNSVKNKFKFRLATIKDSDILLEWRNDPETRKWSRNTKIIKKKSHVKWLINSLNDSNRKIYILEYKKRPVGTVRTDWKSGATELSWTVAPEVRGKGIGKKMVIAFVNKIKGPIRSEIRLGNEASKHIAGSVDMKLDYKKNGFLYFQRPINSIH